MSRLGQTFVRAVAAALSPGGANARLSILIFHRVLDRPDPMRPGEPNVDQFRRIVALVKEHFEVLDLADAIGQLRAGTLSPRALSITFDDGYLDNVDNALPVLQDANVSATFFISTGFLDGESMWNDLVIEAVRDHSEASLKLDVLGSESVELLDWTDKRKAAGCVLGRLKYLAPTIRQQSVLNLLDAMRAEARHGLMMTAEGVQRLAAAGMGIGAHTVTHPILASVSDAQAHEEIAASKRTLEEITGDDVRLFAYPNGKPGTDFHARHVSMVRELGFMSAVSTARGVGCATTDPYQLPRFTPWDEPDTRYVLRLLQNCRKRPEVVAAP